LVTDEDDIIIMTSEGIIIRLDTEDISTLKRVTKGVRLMRLADGVKIVSAAAVAHEDEDPQENVAEEVNEGQIEESTEATE
jgi:DNA gyrase subunit A